MAKVTTVVPMSSFRFVRLLVEMLRELPAKSKYRPFYQELFQKLCYRIANLQSSDGFWRASLLDRCV